ncbi:MAG TPA: DUF1343 domain-containing protein [Nitrospirota bacterium]|nr:DUF1343 domain-containing protein [Nitrospirota bacterium]
MPPARKNVFTGLDMLEKSWPRNLRGARVGLVAHPASIDHALVHAVDRFRRSRQFRLSALFGPQHGLLGQTQDNMIEWDGYRDTATGLPVYSLYGKVRKPAQSALEHCDVLAIDLQDVGARYYTFIWTMDLCMEACREAGKTVVILDRPNPLNGRAIEGPVLDPAYASFVGLKPLPVRHGMTIGEIGAYLHQTSHQALDYRVLAMRGWKRSMWFDDTRLPWVLPSPNMPTPDTALVYPGMCLLEGTNLSEGRGTTRPFEIFGAPFVDPAAIVGMLKDFSLPGVVFRPLFFQPTFQKHANTLCGGAQIHVTDRDTFRPFKTGVAILKAIHNTYPRDFEWKQPPYEYEEVNLPIDILAGSDRLRRDIESWKDIIEMEDWWREETHAFMKVRRNYLLY